MNAEAPAARPNLDTPNLDKSQVAESDDFSRQLQGSSRSLWGALAVLVVLLCAGFGWLLGNNRTAARLEEQRQASEASFASTEGDAVTEGDAPAPEPESSDSPASDSPTASAGEAQKFVDCTATASQYMRSVQGNHYQPAVVLDGDESTAWNAENKRHGVGEWVQIGWPGERTVSRVGVIVGYDKRSTKAQYADDPWMWNRNNRLQRATLLFSNGGKIAVSFDDVTQIQYRQFSPVRLPLGARHRGRRLPRQIRRHRPQMGRHRARGNRSLGPETQRRRRRMKPLFYRALNAVLLSVFAGRMRRARARTRITASGFWRPPTRHRSSPHRSHALRLRRFQWRPKRPSRRLSIAK